MLMTLLLAPTAGNAGGTPQDAMVLPVEDVVRLAKKVEGIAAENGARVFLLARVGRPANELPEGVEYTHVSFGVYSSITTSDNRVVPGYSLYNLYQRSEDPARSDLVVDYPVDFLAPAHVLKAGVLIPTPELQQRLLDVISSGDYKLMHNPEYSALANPYDGRYQNCTEFVLDVINAAIYRTTDVAQIKANTRAWFRAQTIHINPFKLLFASLFKPDIRLADQHGPIQTVTYQSIADYLSANGLLEKSFTVTL
jgi:hypothetical protein